MVRGIVLVLLFLLLLAFLQACGESEAEIQKRTEAGKEALAKVETRCGELGKCEDLKIIDFKTLEPSADDKKNTVTDKWSFEIGGRVFQIEEIRCAVEPCNPSPWESRYKYSAVSLSYRFKLDVRLQSNGKYTAEITDTALGVPLSSNSDAR